MAPAGSPTNGGSCSPTRSSCWRASTASRTEPNVFLCVSSFNARARLPYERLGYSYVRELHDYLVRGHSELLFRKSRGPWSEFIVGPA